LPGRDLVLLTIDLNEGHQLAPPWGGAEK